MLRRPDAPSAPRLAIDPDLAEAHVSLAWVKMWHEWDWVGAERAYQRGLSLKPSSVDALNWYGLYLVMRARLAEARDLLRTAKQLDPVNPVIGYSGALATYFARDYDLAIEQFREILDVHPRFIRARMWLGQVLAFRGLHDEAISETARARELGNPQDVSTLEFLGLVNAIAGHRRDSEGILERLIELKRSRYVSPYLIGRIHGGLGRDEEALRWFETAFGIRDHWLTGLLIEPGLDEMRRAGKLDDLTRRVGLRA